MKVVFTILLFVIFFNTQNSAQWIPQNSETTERFLSNYFIDENTGWSAGNNGIIVKTTNGGDIWFSQSINISDNIHSIFFVDSLNGWIALYGFVPERHGSVMHTTDGGKSWLTQLSINGATFHSIYFTDKENGWVVGSSGVTFKTTNGGQSWIDITPTIYWLFSICFLDNQVGWISGGLFGEILKTTNGGWTWFSQSTPTNDRIMSVFFLDSNHGWAVGWGGRIMKTTDGGTNWQLVPSGVVEELRNVRFTDLNNGWIVGLGGIILHSIDGGNSWNIQNSNTSSSLFGLSFVNDVTGWVSGENGIILKTNNGGVPVELVSFSAVQSGHEVQLSWITATEINNQGFEIERKSATDDNWTKLGFVEGNGTTTQMHHYSFLDNISSIIFKDVISYRLKQVDFDGSYEYSKVVEVKVNQPEGYSLQQNFPNPFNPTTKIRFTIPETGFTTLKVFDVLGNEVSTLWEEETSPGIYEVDFNGANLSSGIYYYKLQSGSYVEVKKMILMK
ncbi:Ycf48-like protein precursor [bacterium BMS3Abin03]|nr:Ycf48-like protein precursor [bacterium BMS3Abin03]